MRKMFLILSALFLGSFGMARAEIHNDTYHGVWHSFSGTMSNGAYTCGVGTSSDRLGEALIIKWESNQDGLAMYLSDNAWHITPGIQPNFAFRFDDHPIWTGQGFTTQYVTTFGLRVTFDQTMEFFTQFTDSDSLEFSYTTSGGRANTWHADLNGSDAIAADLQACVARTKRMLGS